MPTIVLAEDHQIFREGLKALLHEIADFEVTAETDDGLKALDLVMQLSPDILVTDLAIPGMDGLELVRRTRKKCPKTGIVVLSGHAGEKYVIGAIRNGACAYVSKTNSIQDLEDAIRSTLAGRRFLSPSIGLDLSAIGAYIDDIRIEDPYDSLTNREREILQLVVEGYKSREISERLFISLKTVDKHRGNLMNKLGRHSMPELVHYAIQRGLYPAGRMPSTGT